MIAKPIKRITIAADKSHEFLAQIYCLQITTRYQFLLTNIYIFRSFKFLVKEFLLILNPEIKFIILERSISLSTWFKIMMRRYWGGF
jgi:hypothetical protein